MKIVVDEQIPLVDKLFAAQKLVKKPGPEIRRRDLIDAQMLWVRTITPVDAALLQDTPVRFVGSATAGYDHLDTAWLEKQGIFWTNAPGANAVAVAEYVLMVIAALQTKNILCHSPLRAGVIGMGHVGCWVSDYLSQAGFEVIVNDPPRSAREENFHSTPLQEFNNLDLISIHAALTTHLPHPSYHLLTDSFFQRQKPGTVIINAARGEIVDTQTFLRQSRLRLCLDVWESEPDINLNLLNQALIATPHIAAYSVAAKQRASLYLYAKAQEFFGWPQVDLEIKAGVKKLPADWQKQALEIFNPLVYTGKMRGCLTEENNVAEKFRQLRESYTWRKSLLSLE